MDVGVVELSGEHDLELTCLGDDPAPHRRAELAERRADHLGVHGPCRHGPRHRCHPGAGIPRRGQGEQVVEGSRRGVAGRQRAGPSPHDERSVAIREVCRYSSLKTEPDGTHGETRMAGTR